MTSPAIYAKAIVAASSALTGTIVTAASDNNVTTVEIIVIVATVIGAAAATYMIPNKDETGEHADESVQDATDEAEVSPVASEGYVGEHRA